MWSGGEKAEDGNPESIFFSKLMDEEVEQALRELPEEYRMAIGLVDIQSKSVIVMSSWPKPVSSHPGTALIPKNPWRAD